MKKLWKMTLAAMLMSLAVCLLAGTAVSAETVGGEIAEGFTWSYDTETRTLTLKGEGEIPEGAIPSPRPWKEYEESIQHVYLEGIASLRVNAAPNATSASGQYGTFSWEMDMPNKTLQVNGTDSVDGGPWEAFADRWSDSYEVTLGDQITAWNSPNLYVHTLHIGAGYSANYFDGSYVIASPDNPYFSTYDGSVYTKGFEKLLRCDTKENPKLHPDVKTIAANAFTYNTGTIIIPWGVTTIEEGAFQIHGATTQIILPDTLTSVKNLFNGNKDNHVTFICSKSNGIVQRDIGNEEDSFDIPVLKVVDSLAEYYPSQATQPEPSAPAESEPSSEPSAPTSSGSSDAKPADKPSGGASSSQPASRPASSSQPESSAPESSAQPAESSAPSAEASEPSAQEPSEDPSSAPESSEAESSSPESSPESSDGFYEDMMSQSETPEQTGGSLSWILPLVIVLGAAAVAAVILVLVLRKK